MHTLTDEFGNPLTLTDVGAMLGLSDAEMAQAVAEPEPEPETPEARLERMRAYRAACNAREAAGIAKAASLEIGQIVRCEDGWWILESRGVRTTWGESGDGFHHIDTQTVTVSKCRADGTRLKSRQYVTADASAFGNAMI